VGGGGWAGVGILCSVTGGGTTRCVTSPYPCLSVYVSTYLCICLSICLCLFVSVVAGAGSGTLPAADVKKAVPSTSRGEALAKSAQAGAGATGGVTKARNPLAGHNPVAASGAVVVAPNGAARFTVLTSQLIRMEYRCVTAWP
jgi:hypothetical protein